MSELIAITLPDRQEAEYARIHVMEMNYVLALSDIVVAEVTGDGSVKLYQSVQMVSSGATERGFLGTLIGLIFLSPLFRFNRPFQPSAGAASGWQADCGIDNQYLKELASLVDPGNAVVFLQVDGPLSKRGLRRLREVGGTVLRTSLDAVDKRALCATLEYDRQPVKPESVIAARADENRMWCDSRPQDASWAPRMISE